MSGRSSPPPGRYGSLGGSRRDDGGAYRSVGGHNLYGLGPATVGGAPYGHIYDNGGGHGGYSQPLPPHMNPNGIGIPAPQIVQGDRQAARSPYASQCKSK